MTMTFCPGCGSRCYHETDYALLRQHEDEAWERSRAALRGERPRPKSLAIAIRANRPIVNVRIDAVSRITQQPTTPNPDRPRN